MKKLYFLLIGLCFFASLTAQVITIPDANFKKKLLEATAGSYIATNSDGKGIKIDSNNDNEIQRDEALAVQGLRLDGAGISNFDGLEYFINIRILECSWNKITSFDANKNIFLKELNCFGGNLINLNLTGLKDLEILNCNGNKIEILDLSGLNNLKFLDCNNNKINHLGFTDNPNIGYINCSVNPIKSLDVSGHTKLISLLCTMNDLSAIDVSNCTKLSQLDCSSNKITTLDLSSCYNLFQFNCNFNRLESLFIKNNFKTNYNYYISFNPTLKYICVDEDELLDIQSKVNNLGYTNCAVNSYCTFDPGGKTFTVEGQTKSDFNNNGCDKQDTDTPNLKFKISDGISSGNFIANKTGKYEMKLPLGNYTITPVIENPSYFNITPSTVQVNFSTQTNPFKQDFCIIPNGVHKDLEISLIPYSPARPGFDATYSIIYKNRGNTSQSGSVALTFNDTLLDYVSATPAINSQTKDKFTWDYSNLLPFETREITVTLNVNSPIETPAVNIGDRLSFNTLINPVTGDEKPVDNSSALRQSVVGSFDPNDKTCLEGDVITPELIGEYVHYLIRFENTGTYPAQNIVMKDMIDFTKLDISTLVPTKASHDFITKISGNKVEFIFENINLPFDNATNDGYIAFKIKTLPTLVTGDSFTNEANIYFDYNFPILTNKATSTFKTLGTQDFEFTDYFSVYPNPVIDILNIGIKNNIEVKSMSVYDVLGQLIIAVPNAKTISKIDVSKLTTGNYFLKMITDKGTSSVKFIKK